MPPHQELLGETQPNLNLLGDSFSIVGTKRLEYVGTSDCFLRFSDTGGLLGQPVNRALSFAHFCGWADTFIASESLSDLQNKAFSFIPLNASDYLFIGSPVSAPLCETLCALWDERRVPRIWFSAKINPAEAQAFQTDVSTAANGMNSLWNPELVSLVLNHDSFPCASGQRKDEFIFMSWVLRRLNCRFQACRLAWTKMHSSAAIVCWLTTNPSTDSPFISRRRGLRKRILRKSVLVIY